MYNQTLIKIWFLPEDLRGKIISPFSDGTYNHFESKAIWILHPRKRWNYFRLERLAFKHKMELKSSITIFIPLLRLSTLSWSASFFSFPRHVLLEAWIYIFKFSEKLLRKSLLPLLSSYLKRRKCAKGVEWGVGWGSSHFYSSKEKKAKHGEMYDMLPALALLHL